MTACNPLGEMVADDVNAKSQSRLENELKFRGLHYIPGEGKHPVGDWSGEPSFLVFGLSQEAVKTRGEKMQSKRYRLVRLGCNSPIAFTSVIWLF